ncbi:motility associated factor glycosyltransferase family protein [Campylobacter jejuni]|nr:motility associated factor glycosyltransferase family protein [Campylobacter jejuni]
MQTNQIYEENLNALAGSQYQELKQKLKKITELRYFNYKIGKDMLDFNIIKKRNLKTIYSNPVQELEQTAQTFKQECFYHSCLFFYGLGNGLLYKILLQNKHLKRLVVFEQELEIIFIVLNFIDLKEELSKGRLILIHTTDINYTKTDHIFSLPEISLFFKTYNLHLHSEFYKAYKEDMIKINTLNLKAIKNISLRRGNDPKDAIQGIEQFVYNIPNMINHLSYQDFIKRRKSLSDTAIIVSTGPSLEKQLPLLKEYSNKATIFCADSAYPILAKHNIKPDYVCMLERDDIVSECFNNDFGDFDKNITFICASLIHKNTIKYLEKKEGSYLLATKNLPFASSINLNQFGYISGGMSVAHMNCEIAVLLKHKNIILIGQDLAYGKKGNSHSQGFIHAKYHDGDYQRDFGKYTTTAYGGKGVVESSEVWTLFREIFENFISETKNISKIYNATEGGARIEGAEEKPFKELCKEFLNKDLKKPFKKLHKLPLSQRNDLMLKAYKNIKKKINLTEAFKKESKKILRKIQKISKSKYSFEEIVKSIDTAKEQLASQKYYFLREILGPTLHHEESLIAPIFVKTIHNESERQNKLLAWILAHESLFETIIDLLEVQNYRLKIAIMPLQNILEKRKLI